jgi:glycerophosphoryl diester phosphodiesterase
MRSSPSGPDPLDPGPAGFAHRGLHGPRVPENSLAAFEAAIAYGAGIECDIRLSSDGSAVVFHDCDLSRMCGVSLKVEQTPAALLTGQRLSGSSQCIPTLGRVLELAGGRVPLLLELKTHRGNAARLCGEVLLDLSPPSGPVGVMSFDPKVGRWFRRNAPHVPRGLVIGDGMSQLKRWLVLVVAAPQFLAVHRNCLGGRWLGRIRKRIPVYAWTIRSPAERAQAEVQADSLIWEDDGGPRN